MFSSLYKVIHTEQTLNSYTVLTIPLTTITCSTESQCLSGSNWLHEDKACTHSFRKRCWLQGTTCTTWSSPLPPSVKKKKRRRGTKVNRPDFCHELCKMISESGANICRKLIKYLCSGEFSHVLPGMHTS